MNNQDSNEIDIDLLDDPSMATRTRVAICTAEGQELNGLGMMFRQYLEQNLADFEYKVEQALRIRCRVAVEVDEGGIAVTTTFFGERIEIENGVIDKPDLYLKSSYLLLAKVLSGTANPFIELFKGNIKLKKIPRRPIQALKVLRFLKIPTELLI